mgnify:CR=1 FL=1
MLTAGVCILAVIAAVIWLLFLSRFAWWRRITVLDVGPALSETVEFFSRYHCRLHFVDLIDAVVHQHEALLLLEQEIGAEELAEELELRGPTNDAEPSP